ncbi:hypothetical protein [Verrucomicrobium sp. BvORR106]|uniref:hypothetical protein n=1 Tax=Verrucomicrobium sp. BvORR106 TaxID=1403819 RepID=UPI002240F5C3|nr:hypothetical protein [Verrucomicrobium sp. BvORR106]
MDPTSRGAPGRVRGFSGYHLPLLGHQKIRAQVQEQCRWGEQISERKSLVFHNFAQSEMLGKVGTLEAGLKNFDGNEWGFLLENFFKYADPAKY